MLHASAVDDEKQAEASHRALARLMLGSGGSGMPSAQGAMPLPFASAPPSVLAGMAPKAPGLPKLASGISSRFPGIMSAIKMPKAPKLPRLK